MPPEGTVSAQKCNILEMGNTTDARCNLSLVLEVVVSFGEGEDDARLNCLRGRANLLQVQQAAPGKHQRRCSVWGLRKGQRKVPGTRI